MTELERIAEHFERKEGLRFAQNVGERYTFKPYFTTTIIFVFLASEPAEHNDQLSHNTWLSVPLIYRSLLCLCYPVINGTVWLKQ